MTATAASLRTRPEGFASGSTTPTVWQRVKRVYQYRRILKLLVTRDLKVRYAGSALGYVWTVLDPLLMSVVYWFVFVKVFKRSAGPEYEPFLIYLVSGQLPWFWFAGGVSGTVRALRGEAQMIRSSNVPRELWVLRVVMSKFVEYVFGLPVLVIFALAYTIAPTPYALLLPLGWVMEFTLLIGFGLLLAPLTVLARDMERVIPIILRVLFYASPVLYSITRLPKNLRVIYQFNPMVGFLEISHAVFFPAALVEHRTVKTHDADGFVGQKVVTVHHWNYIWHSAIGTMIILAIGTFVFIRLERQVLKEI